MVLKSNFILNYNCSNKEKNSTGQGPEKNPFFEAGADGKL